MTYSVGKQGKLKNVYWGFLLKKASFYVIWRNIPTTEKYIEEKYQVKNNNVTISVLLQKEIIEKPKVY